MPTLTLRLSFTSGKDAPLMGSPLAPVTEGGGPHGKQLLISYVRAEAAEHAVLLKDKLTQMGFSVYLVSEMIIYRQLSQNQ